MPEFENFGQYLQAVADAAHSAPHPGLTIQAASGSEGGIPSEGGFLVPQDFAADLAERVYQTGQILSRTERMPMASRRLHVPVIDESSRADGSRFGALAMNWTAEGEPITASRPKFGARLFEGRKAAGLAYVTGELLVDAPALGNFLTRMFTLEAGFTIEDAIVAGTGAGQPLGILAAPCTIEVAKESAQAADTVLAENIVKMWARLWAASKPRAVWLANADAVPQLYGLTWSSGTAVVPLFRWGENGEPMLMGRPVVEVEYCPTLGDRGDIILADLSQYILAERTGAVQAELSMHVRFVFDESAYRFTWRLDGAPAWSTPTTPKNGTATTSPFVVLASRG